MAEPSLDFKLASKLLQHRESLNPCFSQPHQHQHQHHHQHHQHHHQLSKHHHQGQSLESLELLESLEELELLESLEELEPLEGLEVAKESLFAEVHQYLVV